MGVRTVSAAADSWVVRRASPGNGPAERDHAYPFVGAGRPERIAEFPRQQIPDRCPGKRRRQRFELLELHAESGDLEFPQELVVAHVSQETEPSPQASLDFVLDGDEELRAAERGRRAPRATSATRPKLRVKTSSTRLVSR